MQEKDKKYTEEQEEKAANGDDPKIYTTDE